ncbi:MAG: endonuclease/exonuclease/phosphatase family protein [Saprospiraceae bacterium]|nr:endonuclease/exonuclease/phosphatase family protein [Saprospiraceae bacterium]
MILFLLIISCGTPALTQETKQQYKIGCLAFWNFENLFDLEDDPTINDDDFTPEGSLRWTAEKYAEKMGHLADVISEIGTELNPDGAALLGVSEIENRKVLEDLVKEKKILARDYKIVHFDSPDRRGIDVGLLYQEKYFKPHRSTIIPFDLIKENGDTVFTRDILMVQGMFDGEDLTVLVNHWPSRRGGEAASRYLREHSASHCKRIIDSLEQQNPAAKIVIMGDLNDDPVSSSLKNILKARGKSHKVKEGETFNPMFSYFKKGIGTTAWRDAWSLFDQIVLSRGFISKDNKGYQFYQARIHNPRYLVQKTGRYQGYPFRTFAGGSYVGGYSDHYAVYAYLVKPI